MFKGKSGLVKNFITATPTRVPAYAGQTALSGSQIKPPALPEVHDVRLAWRAIRPSIKLRKEVEVKRPPLPDGRVTPTGQGQSQRWMSGGSMRQKPCT